MNRNAAQDRCDVELIRRYLEGDCDATNQSWVEQHLDTCMDCRERMRDEMNEDWLGSAKEFLTTDDLDRPDEAHGSNWQPATIGDLERPSVHHDGLQRVLELLDPSEDPHMLGRLCRYEVVGAIGFGGMAVVLKGFEPALNRFVAIKVLAPHLAASKTARERFSREARAAASVLHPNVIAIHSVAQFKHLPYLVMPYVAGGSLRERISDGVPLELKAVLRVGMQVASGLAAAHEQGLVHRDIKPGNVLLEPGLERVAITDFGLARAADDASITQTGILAGTPHYMSPEQAKGDKLDHRSDLFSLGSLLFKLATGKIPFHAETSYGVLRKIVEADAPDPRVLNDSVPYWLATLITRLHKRDPDERYQSSQEVADLLRQCLASVQGSDGGIPNSLLPSEQPPIPKTLIAIVCLACLCVASWIGWRSWKPESTAKATTESNSSATLENQPLRPAWAGQWAIFRGRVVLDGEPPASNMIEVTRDRRLYEQDITDETLIVDEATRGIANVFVWLEGPELTIKVPPNDSPLPESVLLQFDDGRIFPHAITMRPSQTIRLRNRDPIKHYVSFGNLMNVELPAGTWFANEFPTDSDPLIVSCEFHPWMGSCVLIQDHGFAAISRTDGAFEIPYAPRGEWKLRIWHEALDQFELSDHASVSTGPEDIRLNVDRELIELDIKLRR